MTGPERIGDPEASAGGEKPERSGRRIAAWAVAIAVALGLFVFAPGPVLTVLHKREAAQLVDRVDERRTEVLERAEEGRAALAPLGAPVRSWSEVRCALRPRYSDGDGEQNVVVFYYQSCAPVVREIYALPQRHRSLKKASALLNGRTGHWKPDCYEPILDVIDLRMGQVDADGFSMALDWIDLAGSAADGSGCQLPSPEAETATRIQMSADGPLTESTYVVFTVFGEAEMVDIGCRRNVGWIGVCTAVPKDAPYL